MENVQEVRIKKEFRYDGFGVPVVFLDVPVVKVQGEWVPKIDLDAAMHALAVAVARKPTSLTGNEVRFVRHLHEMTLTDFGKRFGVSHAAVTKWEKTGDGPTKMGWPTEKDLRMFVLELEGLECGEFKRAYEELATPIKSTKRKPKPLRLDYRHAAPVYA